MHNQCVLELHFEQMQTTDLLDIYEDIALSAEIDNPVAWKLVENQTPAVHPSGALPMIGGADLLPVIQCIIDTAIAEILVISLVKLFQRRKLERKKNPKKIKVKIKNGPTIFADIDDLPKILKAIRKHA